MSLRVIAAALRAATRARRSSSLSVRALAVTLEVNHRADLPQADLRALLGSTDMQISRAVATAVRAGLITRVPREHQSDNRRVTLRGTSDGRALLTLLERSTQP